MKSIKVTPLADDLPFGARISGVDWETVRDEAVHRQLKKIFDDRGVIVFLDMERTIEMQIALSNIFGPLQDHPLKDQPRATKRQLMEIGDRGTIAETNGDQLVSYVPWHYDSCYTAKLNRAGVLRAIELPPEGGMTGFADGVQLYDAISRDLRAEFESLYIIYHSKLMLMHQRFGVPKDHRWVGLSDAAIKMLEGCENAPRALHPAIWRRQSGENVLHVSPWQAAGIFGREDTEGDALLETLCEEIYARMKPYWHTWAPTDMIIWDNWRFIHAGSGNNVKYARLMHRTTIEGDYGLGRFEHAAAENELFAVRH